MDKIRHYVQEDETDKTTYEKPMMQVYEMEIEGAILQASGSDTQDGGAWGNDE